MPKRITTHTIRKMKNTELVTVLTAYDYPTAKIVDSCECDIILVGDSLGNVILGYENSTYVTMNDMLHHTAAVSRGARHALIVADMPFLSYHTGEHTAIKNAGKLISRGGAHAVKLEGGAEVAPVIKAITSAGIPVMAHLGFTPQSVNQIGGTFIQGKTDETADKLIRDAKALEQSGAFAIVLECIPHALAQTITQNVSIPTIGIGAGPHCDGQVLVLHDMIGLYEDFVPSFVKKYANLNTDIRTAVNNYISEVKGRVFPQ